MILILHGFSWGSLVSSHLTKILLGGFVTVNCPKPERVRMMCVHVSLPWIGVPAKVYSYLVPSVPVIDIRSTTPLNRIKGLPRISGLSFLYFVM